MDHALFKGAKGIRVRCRRCGNSLDVLNPVGIASDRNVVNDTSFSRDPSGNNGIEPAVSLAGQEQSTPPEMELTLPVGEPACLSQEDGEEEKSWEEILRKPLPVSAKGLSRPTFRGSSLIVLFIFLLLFVGGSAYLIFTKVGKGMLSGIGQNLADAPIPGAHYPQDP
jgi:hypothetical protein